MSFDEEPDHVPTKEEFESAMLISDALAVIRQAAMDGRIDGKSLVEFGQELIAFSVSNRPDYPFPNPFE
ncbi:MAG: hypothetical protein HQL93_04115 [Magnetococcales bacterium]|nr:hypothetical protein [Magnetococcales bacterium]